MIGHGVVFGMYDSGEIDGDDEVAVAHTTEPQCRQLSDPLVNFRYAVRQAGRAMAIDRPSADGIVAIAKSLHYTERTWRGVEALIRRTRPSLGEPLASLRSFLAEHPWYGDVKKADAIDTFTRLAEISSRARTPGQWWHSQYWRNRHLCDWETQFAGIAGISKSEILRYQQLYNPSFPHYWRRLVLDSVRKSHEGSADASDDGLPAAALAAAASWGLSPGRLPRDRIERWTTSGERIQLTDAELLLLAVVRSYRPPSVIYRISTGMPGLLGDESVHQAVIESHVTNHELAPHARRTISQIKQRHLIEHLRRAWRITEQDPRYLQAAAWDRGFDSPDEAASAARPFFLRHYLMQRGGSRALSDHRDTLHGKSEGYAT
jgi:hypothetical protein